MTQFSSHYSIYRNLLILLMILLPVVARANLALFADSISKECPNQSVLLVKKVAIELRETNKCDERFSSDLLKKCPALDCRKLSGLYRESFLIRKGTVIGE